jgi:hypothetical protein
MERRDFDKHVAYSTQVYSRLVSPRHFLFADAGRFFQLWNVADKKLWYLDHGKLAGYDGVTKRFIGTIEPRGVDGMADELLPTQNYYNYFYNNYYQDPSRTLVSAKTVYEIDLKARSISPIYTVAGGDEIGAFAESAMSYDPNLVAQRQILVTTRRFVRVLKPDGAVELAIPYLPAFSGYPQVQVSFLLPTNNFAVWFSPDYQLNEKSGWTMPEQVKWIAADNSETRNLDLPVLRQSYPESLANKLSTTLVPPALLVAVDVATEHKRILNFEHALSLAWDLTCVVVVGWLTRRHRFSTGATIGWGIFVLIFGIPGLLAFLSAQEWPVREICPNCNTPRVVSSATCEHCDSPWPPPEINGTEIFAPLVKV